METSQSGICEQSSKKLKRETTLEVLKCYEVYCLDEVSFRLYSDSRPRCLETSDLQKGLIMVFEGRELSGEGMGFGVPVVRYSDGVFFSMDAKTQILKKAERSQVLEKIFYINATSRKILRNIAVDTGLYRKISSYLQRIYQKGGVSEDVLKRLMEIQYHVGVKTKYVRTQGRGEVLVRYSFDDMELSIEIDFDGLDKKGCEELIILNEQGLDLFMKYEDSGGTTLVGREIGAWMKVDAESALISSLDRRVGFTLRNHLDVEMIRGMEQEKGRFAWIGLNYILRPSISLFTYTVNFRGGRDG